MTGTKINDALTRQSGGEPPALEEIIRREQRRVRRWAIATTTLWIITAAYLFGLLCTYAVFIHPRISWFFTANEPSGFDMKPVMRVTATMLLASLYWPALLLLSAACTLFFNLASRRATLRQIQASLTDISTQLRELTRQA